jgi:ADP-heptose:LPS heptosyltransferase
LAETVLEVMRHEALNLAGATTVGMLGALIARAALVVCNDTGTSHLAAALATPSVVISTGDNPDRWAPKNQMLHSVLCRAGGVSPEEAIAAAQQHLNLSTTAGPRAQRALAST